MYCSYLSLLFRDQPLQSYYFASRRTFDFWFHYFVDSTVETFSDELLKTFIQLNYKIERHEDLKSHQILEVADTLSKQDHSRYSSMVVCILSHGGLRSVYGVDGFPVPIRTVTQKFTGSNCKSLAGKPKLFFVQACQGSKEQIVQRK